LRAALLTAHDHPLEVVDDVEIEAPRAGEVMVRVSHCGVCHSDLSIVDGTFPAALPVVLGHEAAGIVEEVGPGVESLRPGDHVVLSPAPPCGRCPFCLRGQFSICVNSAAVMMNMFNDGTTRLSRQGATVYRGLGVGAFGERMITQESGAVKVADDTPLDVACVIGCAVQTGVGAVFNTAKVEPGDTVLVLGLGGVGIAIVQGARIAGAARIIVSDPVGARRDAAAHFGATDEIDPTVDDVVARAHELTGIGVDYAFEAVGKGALGQTAIWATRPGGTAVLVGAAPIEDAITIEPAPVFMATERRLVGSFLGSSNSPREIPRLLALWRAGKLDLEGMISHRRPLTEVNEAFDDLRATRGLRTVLEVSRG
jgi:S-(hydroxymethyl)glutathione dehydrogenase / alcohol dehydrogenase